MDLILLEPGSKDIFSADPNDITSDQEAGRPDFDLKHCIELVSVHHGLKQQIAEDVSNAARTSGRPTITEFTCVKYTDKTSVKLYDYCLRAMPLGKGQKEPTKIHICRNSGEALANILTFSLRDALITEIQFQTHPNDMPTEQFKLNFTEILWEVTVQTPTAGRAGSKAAGWSLLRNRPIGAFTGDDK
jgi:type VI secretion system secreted protein Hcp